MIQAAWDAIVELVMAIVTPLVDAMMAAMPDAALEMTGTVVVALSYVDAWLPVHETIAWVIAYWTFVGAFFGVKMVIKLLPWIG